MKPRIETIDRNTKIDRRKGSYLPHWTTNDGVYHIRFSLFDSFPASIRQNLINERDRILAKVTKVDGVLTGLEKRQLIQMYVDRVEAALDQGYGECWLSIPEIADVVSDTLTKFDGKKYNLFAWCIMPNHVHTIIQPIGNYTLSKILHSWKSYTANQANRILGRSGTFWQSEYFDHLIRNSEQFDQKLDYVWRNPEKAGFKNWKWRWKTTYAGSV